MYFQAQKKNLATSLVPPDNLEYSTWND